MSNHPSLSQQTEERIAWPIVLLVSEIIIAMRLFPHPMNFVPLGALALFCGARLSGWRAFVPVIAVMAISDVGLYLLKGFTPNLIGAGCLLLWVLMGKLLRQTENPLKIGAGFFAGSLSFFFLTNFYVWLASDPVVGSESAYAWLSDPKYGQKLVFAKSLTGLWACFELAIPFYRNQFLADALVTPLLFGYAFWMKASLGLRPVRVRASQQN